MNNKKKAIIWSGTKSALVSIITALVGFTATGRDPFAKDTWWVWLTPVVLGILKGGEKANTLKGK